MIERDELIAYLNDYLALREIPDYKEAYNGLQVEGRREIRRVAVAVDAAAFTIDRALEADADLLLVHHGLFWGAKVPITGMVHRRLAPIIKRDLNVYSCHLPLDVHPEVGNNHVLARMLGLEPAGTWGDFEGVPIGVWAEAQMPRDEFVRRVSDVLNVSPLVVPAGPEITQRIGILTGGGGSLIGKALGAKIDTYLTGEGAHHTYFDAEERGLNLIYAGHYATETVGVRALARHLEARFGLETVWIDHPTGL